ncbi:MAG: LiaI-LiaF-like domain-containing protein [Terriglobales bacterium]
MSDTTLQPEPIRRSQCGRGLFGPLVIIALGVIFLLDQLRIVNAGYAFSYFWPAVIIIFGIELLSWRPQGARPFWGIIAIVVGAGLILSNLGYWYFDVGRWWPLILIAVGVSLLFRRGGWRGPYNPHWRGYSRHHWRRDYAWAGDSGQPGGGSGGSGGGAGAATAAESTMPSDGEDFVHGVAVLGGFQRRVTSQQFRGGHLDAFMGGIQLDLHRAEIAGERAVLDVNTMFGGAEIRVPERWIVELRGQPFLGGYSDETRQDTPAPGAKRLILTGWSIFGGVVVKN